MNIKRFAAFMLAVIFVLCLSACGTGDTQNGGNGGAEFDKEGYRVLLDNAAKLPSEFSEELLNKVMHPGEIKYKSDFYASEKNEDFIALVREEFETTAQSYAETYGDDWKITYTVNEAVEKDAEGIQNYKEFDGFYFNTYNIDTDKIQAVTFAKVTVHIEGSKDFNDKDKTIQCFCIDGVWYSFYAVRLGLKL